MSTLYEASVKEIENDKTVVFHVQVVHPDSMYITDSPGFCLMLLWESASGAGPISEEVDLDTVLDAGWMKKYAKGFIKTSEIVSLENEPPHAAFDDYEHTYWENSSDWMHGDIRIEVTDPAWISHLSKGSSWDSTAFDATGSYDPCDPILHEKDEPSDDEKGEALDERAGLIPVPRIFFLDYLAPFEDEFIWMPKYSDKAYKAEKVYEDAEITNSVLESLVGKVVWYSKYGDGVGVLSPENMVIYISSGSRGGSGFGPGEGKIGPAIFNTKKKRLADPLSIPSMARSADPVVHHVDVNGNVATMKVYAFNDDRELTLEHHGNAFALLVAAECDTFDGLEHAESRFGKWVNQQAANAGISYADKIYAKFAKGIVVEWHVEKTKEAENVDWDALEGDALLEKLKTNPWAEWTVSVTVTDPEFLVDLPSLTPFRFGFNWVNEPEDCEPMTF